MALVKVEWQETVRYEAEIEIDGFDPRQAKKQITEAILDEAEGFTPSSYSNPQRITHRVVRPGDATPEIAVSPNTGEEDWEF